MSSDTNLPALSVPVQTTLRSERDAQITPGSWWMLTEDWQRMEAGEVLLVSDVAWVDGEPHSLTVLCPPHRVSSVESALRHGMSSWSVLAKDWLNVSKPVSYDEAMACRSEDMKSVVAKAEKMEEEAAQVQGELQNLLSLPPPNLSLSAPGLETENRAHVVARNSEIAVERATRMQEMTEELTKVLMNAGMERSRVALFASERAQAAVAAAKPVMQVARRLQEGVRTTSFYLGVDCEVETLVEGRGAAADEPLVFMQRRLFMDEETLVHIEMGGLSVDNNQNFGQLLKAQPELVERIFGHSRAVVVASWRRRPADYGLRSDASPAEMLAHAMFSHAKNEENLRPFLLIRDGERVYRVGLPDEFKGLNRLFPNREDLENAYTKRGWYGEAPIVIGPDSLEYAKASEQFRSLSLLYSRVLTILWGLQDRQGLLGEFPAEYANSGLVNPDFQSACMRFVYDDQNVIGDGRPTYVQWFGKMNSNLRPGCWVLVNWRSVMNSRTAPGAVRQDSRGNDWFAALPIENFSIVRTRLDAGQIVVDCPVKQDSWRSDREFMARTVLTISHEYRFSFLVLDQVRADDVDFYLNSRQARVDYESFVPVLIRVREYVKKRDLAEAGAFQELLNAVESARMEPPEGGWTQAIRQVMADHRMASKTGELPETGSPEWVKAKKAMFNALGNMIRSNDLAGDIKRFAEDLGLTPIAVTTDNAGRPVLYVQDTRPNPQDDTWTLPWPFMKRLVLKYKGAMNIDIASTTLKPMVMSSFSAETMIERFVDVPKVRSTPLGFSGKDLKELFEELKASLHDPFRTPTPDGLNAAMRAANVKGRFVIRPLLARVMGFAFVFTSEREAFIRLLLETQDALTVLHRSGDQGRLAAEDMVRASYAQKEHQLSVLREKGVSPGLYQLNLKSLRQFHALFENGYLSEKVRNETVSCGREKCMKDNVLQWKTYLEAQKPSMIYTRNLGEIE